MRASDLHPFSSGQTNAVSLDDCVNFAVLWR